MTFAPSGRPGKATVSVPSRLLVLSRACSVICGTTNIDKVDCRKVSVVLRVRGGALIDRLRAWQQHVKTHRYLHASHHIYEALIQLWLGDFEVRIRAKRKAFHEPCQVFLLLLKAVPRYDSRAQLQAIKCQRRSQTQRQSMTQAQRRVAALEEALRSKVAPHILAPSRYLRGKANAGRKLLPLVDAQH